VPDLQARGLEIFVGRKQKAGQQQQARCDWLLAHQRLEQEGADCEAALAGWVGGSALAQACVQLGEPDSDAKAVGTVSQALQDSASSSSSSSSIAEAVALAQAVAKLLAATGPAACHSDPGQLAGLQHRLLVAEQPMQQQLGAAQAAASDLLGQAQHQFAAVCRPSASTAGSDSLPEQVQQACTHHPLADAESKAQLLQDAAEAQAGHPAAAGAAHCLAGLPGSKQRCCRRRQQIHDGNKQWHRRRMAG
jgi:hypothetical protein